MIETITFEGEVYPKFQSTGFAAQFAFPFAEQVCKGEGFDVGCNRVEWKLPNAIPIDPLITPAYHAHSLPPLMVDYIFSSHCLEHVDDWVGALDHWTSRIKTGGVLFLYLPDFSQWYWRPWNNRKHKHVLTPEIIRAYLEATGKYRNIFVSGIDLNNSFMAIAEKI